MVEQLYPAFMMWVSKLMAYRMISIAEPWWHLSCFGVHTAELGCGYPDAIASQMQ